MDNASDNQLVDSGDSSDSGEDYSFIDSGDGGSDEGSFSSERERDAFFRAVAERDHGVIRSDVANASASADDDVTVSYDGGQWETNALTLAAPLEEGTCSGNEANIHAEKYGETRLHIVVKDRSLKADKFETFLSKGVQINAVDRLGRTALHYAA